MKGQPLPIPTAGNLADQCREMGLSVGDVIQGREEASYREGGFHETRLKLLWLGEREAVFLEQKRSDLQTEWSKPVEDSSWTLEHALIVIEDLKIKNMSASPSLQGGENVNDAELNRLKEWHGQET